MFCCIITANCHLHRAQASQPYMPAWGWIYRHKRSDRCCSEDGKGSLANNVCIFYTTYWQLRDLHTRGNGRKRWAGGSPAAQESWEHFQELHYKSLQQGARWCDRLSWMCARTWAWFCSTSVQQKAFLGSDQMGLLQSWSFAWELVPELGLSPETTVGVGVRAQVACIDERDQVWQKWYLWGLHWLSWGTGLVLVWSDGFPGWQSFWISFILFVQMRWARFTSGSYKDCQTGFEGWWVRHLLGSNLWM